MSPFSGRLLDWYDAHGRHDLPWQHTADPYRIWLSEVMLQQTQVATAIPYFERFVARFPDVRALAAAADDDVMRAWAGLGYYARARNLSRAARWIVSAHGGSFPRAFDAIAALPGVGPSTAGAIAALAFGERHPILDGNCKRVYARHAGIEGWPGERTVAQRLWQRADECTPHARVAAYTQAVMDLGATVCTRARARCGACPVSADCAARAAGAVAEFPAPRPRKARPRRRAVLLVAQDDRGGVLLERRPERGIWGGLWCAPLVADGGPDAADAYGLRFADAHALDPVHHAFTHFTLEIEPLHLRGASVAAAAEWVPVERLDEYALPAPVRRILGKIAR